MAHLSSRVAHLCPSPVPSSVLVFPVCLPPAVASSAGGDDGRTLPDDLANKLGKLVPYAPDCARRRPYSKRSRSPDAALAWRPSSRTPVWPPGLGRVTPRTFISAPAPSLSLELRSRGAAGIQPPLQSIDRRQPRRLGRTGRRCPSAFPHSSPNFRFGGVVGWRACHLDRRRRPLRLNDFIRSCVILPANSPLAV
jgi:hypothetical protein